MESIVSDLNKFKQNKSIYSGLNSNSIDLTQLGNLKVCYIF